MNTLYFHLFKISESRNTIYVEGSGHAEHFTVDIQGELCAGINKVIVTNVVAMHRTNTDPIIYDARK
jgi:hypothetical protein